MNPQLVVGTLEQDRQEDRLRARFRVVLAGVALAESAEYALLERQAFGVDVGLAQIRWLRVGMISSHGCGQGGADDARFRRASPWWLPLSAPRSIENCVADAALTSRSRTRPPGSVQMTSGSASVRSLARNAS